MGREIRRVPPSWKHPENVYCPHLNGHKWSHGDGPCFQPLYDESYDLAAQTWIKEFKKFKPSAKTAKYFWDWSGMPPKQEYYRPEWKKGTATWFQVYETVSEGTPVTPPFETQDELIAYLSTKGDFWDHRRGDGPWTRANAEAFVKEDGWVPSMMMAPGKGLLQSKDISAGLKET